MVNASGGCLCGAVRFDAAGVETAFHACHCPMCRRWSGGSPFFGATVASVAFASTENVGRYASSSWAERGFCKQCGTTLFYYLKPASQYTLSVGTFDDQKPFELVREIFIDHKPAGYALAGEHPRLTEREVLAAYGK
jgi:hypothetical protein